MVLTVARLRIRLGVVRLKALPVTRIHHRVVVGFRHMTRLLPILLLIVACAAEPDPTTTTVDLSGIVDEQIANETSCDNLERMVQDDTESLDAQAADPDYGMTDEQVTRAEQRVAQASERMGALDC